MAKWEDIVKANESIKTTDIKGKAYAEVNQRIKAFRMNYPEGFIRTELLSNEAGNDGFVCVFRAVVGYHDKEGEAVVLGTGTAYEKESTSYINKTSYIENCETSAVGRALGMAGYGIDTSVASAEEVTNAINQQEQIKSKEKAEANSKDPIDEVKVKALIAQCKDDGVNLESLLKLYKLKKVEDCTVKQWVNMQKNWKQIVEMNGGEIKD